MPTSRDVGPNYSENDGTHQPKYTNGRDKTVIRERIASLRRLVSLVPSANVVSAIRTRLKRRTRT